MPRIDFFNFFRWMLALVATVYATVVTLQSLWGWYVVLKGKEKHIAVLRRYLIVHLLKLRFRTFWGDVVVCILLCIAFVIMWHAHQIINETGERLAHVR
jgi:hypothetical protein